MEGDNSKDFIKMICLLEGSSTSPQKNKVKLKNVEILFDEIKNQKLKKYLCLEIG